MVISKGDHESVQARQKTKTKQQKYNSNKEQAIQE